MLKSLMDMILMFQKFIYNLEKILTKRYVSIIALLILPILLLVMRLKLYKLSTVLGMFFISVVFVSSVEGWYKSLRKFLKLVFFKIFILHYYYYI